MTRIIIDGEKVQSYSIFTAPTFAVIALQTELGLSIPDIVAKVQDPVHQAWATKVSEFIAEHARGNRVTFEELLLRPMPVYVSDPDEVARYAAAKGQVNEADPTQAGTVTPADPDHEQLSEISTVIPNRAERRASTHRSTGSGKKNRGSKGKSARG